jgi:D-alanine-D-alanine ligase
MGLKVAVLMGGKSFEREFSLESGKLVCEALEQAGHKVVPLDTNAQLVPTLRSEKPDVVYNALHGKHGEDGTIQSLLEFLGIPFVGSPASVCHRAYNKDALHSSLAKYREITGDAAVASWPQGIYITRDAFKDMGAVTALDLIPERVAGGFPLIVKPAHGGSALGVHKVDKAEDLGEAILDALSYDDAVNIEQFVEGVEISVAVLGNGWDAYALPPVEIVAQGDFYDADARLNAELVDMYCPVRNESLSADEAEAQAIRAEIERAALEVYHAYNVRDLGRIDMIWDGAQAKCFEVDVSPGMTSHSLFPKACEAAGLSMSAVLDELVKTASGRAAFER